MDLGELHQKLIAAARANPPSEQVPFAFEQRILARLIKPPVVDGWELWSRALWRAAAPCVGLMLLLSAWSFFAEGDRPAQPDLSQALDNTVLAATDQVTDSSW